MKKDPIQLQQRLIYYRAELDKYKKKVQDYQENYHYSQLEKLKTENEELIQEIEDWKKREAASQGELKRRIQGFEIRTARLEKQEERMRKELQTWQEQNAELKEQKRGLFHKVKGLEGTLGEVNEKLSQSQKDMNHLQLSYVQLKKDFHRVQSAKTACEHEITKLAKSVVDLEDQLQEANQTIAQSIEVQGSLKSKVNNLKGTVTQQEKELESRALEMKKLQTEQTEIIEQREHWKERYESEVRRLENKVKEYQEEANKQQEEIKTITDERNRFEDSFEQQKAFWLKQSNEEKNRIEQLNKEIESLRQEKAELEKQYEDHKGSLEKEKAEESALLADMEEQLQFLLGGAKGEENIFNGKAAVVKALEQKLEELTSDLLDLESSIDEID